MGKFKIGDKVILSFGEQWNNKDLFKTITGKYIFNSEFRYTLSSSEATWSEDELEFYTEAINKLTEENDNKEKTIRKLAEQNQLFYIQMVKDREENIELKQSNKMLKEESKSLLQHNILLVKVLNNLL